MTDITKVHQWRSELRKHVHLRENPEIDDGGINLLVMDSPKQALPEAKELMKYDIVLFSKTRFEREIMDGSDKYGRTTTNVPAGCRCPYIGATRTRHCTCLKTNDIYSSPLKELHWLRIIIDEGHEFSSSSSNAVLVAEKLITAERRWIVSGTPAKDRLFGIEVDLAALAEAEGLPGELFDPSASPTNSDSSSNIEPSLVRQAALEKRKRYNRDEEITGAAKSIGIMASNFLKVRPWAEADDDRKVEWDDCIYRHESFRGRTYSAFSTCLRRTLETLVVKTLPNDVEKDIVLPPLEHNVVYLEPSFYDKLTANLFILFLTTNAVTSERTDVDYLFHKNSTKSRYQLITNLRQSNFFWTGFSEADVVSAIGHGIRYLEKENTNCTPEDSHLLQESLKFAQMLLVVDGWKALIKSHEVGIFVDCWLDVSCSWSLNQNALPHMIGVTQLLQAQGIVNNQLFDANPTEGLEAAGIAAVTAAFEADDVRMEKKSTPRRSESKMGVPSSGLHSEPSAAKRYSLSSTTKAERSPKSKSNSSLSNNQKTNSSPTTSNTNPITSSPSRPTSHKRKRSLLNHDLPKDSHLAHPSIVGTTSAKLSYLLTRITALHATEKILVFYDGDNTAYYIAQCLELLHIKHLIYAKSLTNELRSKYIVAFDSDISIRVLLMDIRCGALGLNVNKASRVFFVNPVCRPSIEAQAIKRSHRIGQNKPVYVETLILKGTIEEKIFERAKNMTRREHLEASQLSDDQGVTSIIQNARMLPVDQSEGTGERQMARLDERLQIFGRNGRGDTKIKGIDLDFDRMEEQEKEVGKEEEKAGKKQKQSSSNGSGKRKAKRAEWQIPNYVNDVGSTASVLPQEKMDVAVEIPVWKHPVMFATEPSSMVNSVPRLDMQVGEASSSANKSIFG
jgi:SNF2 family DNA or RNA helicase